MMGGTRRVARVEPERYLGRCLVLTEDLRETDPWEDIGAFPAPAAFACPRLRMEDRRFTLEHDPETGWWCTIGVSAKFRPPPGALIPLRDWLARWYAGRLVRNTPAWGGTGEA